MAIAIGQRLGSYEVSALLGKGGMGQVYRARDTKLKRDVAIKILPDEFCSDADRVSRFQREAEVLASLNHQHIAAIYDLVDFGQSRFLVLELVEGETLADRITRGPIPINESLAMAKQMADALEAAHEKGVTHRDFKPANIKITPRGIVKVLDFGLAKVLASNSAGVVFSEMPTVTLATAEGIVVGTAAYMSPEQARGQMIDRRSDIWSFGCVLFEMLTSRRAFVGATVPDIIAAVIEREPEWNSLPAALPMSIRRLILRCLHKDPRRRLHDIADARLEIDDALANPAGSLAVSPSDPSKTRRDRMRGFAVGVLVAALLGTTTFLIQRRSASESPPVFSRIVRLTSGPAIEFGPAISPDGKWVAYLSNERGPFDVWVKYLSGGEPGNLTASTNLDVTNVTGISGLDISPDGTRVAVMARVRGTSSPLDTWEIPAPLPGVPHKLLVERLGLRWSPDGRQIAFIFAGGSAGDALYAADADGTNVRELVKAQGGRHIHWPAWSRDGYIYFIHNLGTVLNGEPSEIARVNSLGGAVETVVPTTRRANFPLPMPNGGGLIYAANPHSAELSLWWKPVKEGAVRQLTLGAGEYAEPRISADGRMLVATLIEARESLNRITVTSQPAQVTPLSNGFSGDLDPTASPDGKRLVFTSSRAGNRHLWTSNLDGSQAQPLTSGNSFDERPAFSPDGQQIAFVSDRGGGRAIWIINADGGAPRKVADVSVLSHLTWSPDGHEIVYAAGAGDGPGLWSVSVQKGTVTRISTPGLANEPTWSAARQLIAYIAPASSGSSFTGIAFLDANGKTFYETLPPPPSPGGFSNGFGAWAPDGRRLAVVSQAGGGIASIWIVEPDGPVVYRKLIELPPGPRVRGMTWTADGSALIVGKRDTTSDIVIFESDK